MTFVLIVAGSAFTVRGAEEWCSARGLEMGGFHSKKMSLSVWPPGIRCAMRTTQKGAVELTWPF